MISTFSMLAGLMHFQNMDNLRNFHVYSLAWRFTDNPADPWTRRMNAFKENEPQAVGAACAVMSQATSRITWGQTGRRFTLVSAIPHAETALPQTAALFQLGQTVAANNGWEWEPNALSKNPHQSLHNMRGGCAQRDAEVAGKYAARTGFNSDFILILDDFTTRGSTIAEIARALRVRCPNAVIGGLVLGKTERQTFAAERGLDLNNNHVPADYATLWDRIQ